MPKVCWLRIQFLIKMETIRAFIAIALPLELKQQLARLQASLNADNRLRIKWVKPEGIHLTLKFLGNIPGSGIDRITRAMTNAATQITPFYLETEALGAFPDLKRVQVVWLGLGGEIDKLEQLQQLIETKLTHLGFATEQRNFKPHLTLARLSKEVPASERQRMGELIADSSTEMCAKIKVDNINLVKSQLTGVGAIYTVISSASLLKEP